LSEYKAVEFKNNKGMDIDISIDRIRMKYINILKQTTKYGQKIADIDIFKYNDDIDLGSIYHIIQDLVTRYNFSTMNMTMIIKDKPLEKIFNNLPRYAKEGIDNYRELRSVFNVNVIPFNHMKEKCIIIHEKNKYKDNIRNY